MIFSSTALRNASRLGLIRRFPTANSTANCATTQLSLRHKSTASSGGIPAPLLQKWYNIFGKSTIGYATWLVAGIIVAEGMTGWMGDFVWNTVNSGRTFESVDWSKFKTEDDDEDEEDDDDEDDEEEEEGDDDDEDDE
jgi:hypothetical protein